MEAASAAATPLNFLLNFSIAASEEFHSSDRLRRGRVSEGGVDIFPGVKFVWKEKVR